ncbi:U-box domain-containing protein 4 [Glycine soja]|nr:U-box domain-containing protein 4 [Glycine soja]
MVSAEKDSNETHRTIIGKSMRTVRSKIFQHDHATCVSDNLTGSLMELASRNNKSVKSSITEEQLLELSQALSDFSACSSDISGELQRLATRGKKDALTTLYKLCSVRQNKERAVSAGAVRPLVELVAEEGSGMAEKAMVVLNSLAGIEEGKEAIVEEGGIAALVEAIEVGSVKGKEFAVLTLYQLCAETVTNRALLVREGGIPPLVALSQSSPVRAKLKAETLLGYLRESRHEASCSSP